MGLLAVCCMLKDSPLYEISLESCPRCLKRATRKILYRGLVAAVSFRGKEWCRGGSPCRSARCPRKNLFQIPPEGWRAFSESRKAAFTPGASVQPASTSEKMLRLCKRFDNHLTCIKGDMEVHAGRRELRDQGRSISLKRVARLMREADLSAKRKRRRVITTKRNKTHPVAPNILNREFAATEANKKWVTDITYIPDVGRDGSIWQ